MALDNIWSCLLSLIFNPSTSRLNLDMNDVTFSSLLCFSVDDKLATCCSRMSGDQNFTASAATT